MTQPSDIAIIGGGIVGLATAIEGLLHRTRDEPCGKIIVATDEGELGRLQNIYERGQANGLRA